MGDAASRPRSGGAGNLLLIAGIPLAIVACLLAIRLVRPDRAQNERNASDAAESIFAALWEFRRSHPGAVVDAWDGQVAGLAEFVPPGSTPLGLIRPAVAAADPRRPNARPYHGYWFVLLDAEEDPPPVAVLPLSRRRASVCAYPAEYGHGGRSTFLRTEKHGRLKADTKGVPPPRTPADQEVLFGWSKYD